MLTRFLLFEKFGLMDLLVTDSDRLRGKRYGETVRLSDIEQMLVGTSTTPRVFLRWHNFEKQFNWHPDVMWVHLLMGLGGA